MVIDIHQNYQNPEADMFVSIELIAMSVHMLIKEFFILHIPAQYKYFNRNSVAL